MKSFSLKLNLFLLAICTVLQVRAIPTYLKNELITITILAKDKAHCLPMYLRCLENQTWPKNQSYLYIRTNNNNDETATILREWIDTIGSEYLGIYFDDTDVAEQVQEFGQHEWNATRFKVLGKIRQDSLNWAYDHNSHYFIADCDNFIKPHTIESMIGVGLPIVAPFLRLADDHMYSNFHADIDEHGYLKDCYLYQQLWTQEIKGLVQVPVVHCTYFIHNEVLNKLYYDDESYRYEYVIFSDSARKNNIPQYLDTRDMYGRITFTEKEEQLRSEPWIYEFDSIDIKE